MDGTITHYINGTQVEEPLGWSDFEEELDRDIKERLISVKYSSDLTFTGQGYAMLKEMYEQNGFCQIITYQALQDCAGTTNICARGVIILADAEWNLTRCEVAVPVVDDALGARVINNKAIPISPTATLTKNGLALTPVSTFAILLHDPQTSSLLPDTRDAWDWWGAMNHAIAYITDNEVTLVSNWVGSLSDTEQYCLMDGYMLRTFTASPRRVVWTWEELFLDMAGRYNLWLSAERDSSGNPVLRIEHESYFLATGGGVQQLDIQDLTRTVDADRLYAGVEIGSEEFIQQVLATPLSMPYLPLLTHGEERYSFSGVCNTSDQLDLKFTFVSDSNVIEDVILNNNEDYEEKVFLIQYSVPPTVVAARSTPWTFNFGLGGTFPYNEKILNGEILSRYYLQSPVGSNISAPTPFFEEIVGFGPSVPITALNTQSAYFTPFLNYTATASGFYYFEINFDFRIISNLNLRAGDGANFFLQGRIEWKVEHFDSGSTLLNTLTFGSNYFYLVGNYFKFDDFGISLNTGDYLVVSYRFMTANTYYEVDGTGPENDSPVITMSIREQSYIFMIFSTAGGYITGLGKGPILKYSFDRHLDLSTWLSLTSSPRNSLDISYTSDVLTSGWVSNAKRNVSTGACTWEVIAEQQ
jgi:hypothetical protein